MVINYQIDLKLKFQSPASWSEDQSFLKVGIPECDYCRSAILKFLLGGTNGGGNIICKILVVVLVMVWY